LALLFTFFIFYKKPARDSQGARNTGSRHNQRNQMTPSEAEPFVQSYEG
jgi:hypothetical protein